MKIKGKYANAKIFATHIDSSAIDEVQRMVDEELLEGCDVAVMPDVCYADKHSVVGYVQTTKDKIDPRTVSGDIGCGITVFTTNIKADCLNLEYLDKTIRGKIEPIVNKNSSDDITDTYLRLIFSPSFFDELKEINVDKNLLFSQLYTLGNGNHYIELGKDSHGCLTIAVHSGSRGFGGAVLKYFIGIIKKNNAVNPSMKKEIEEIKAKFSGKEIEEKIKELKLTKKNQEQKDYLYKPEDIALYKKWMLLATRYASLNRKLIAMTILSLIGLDCPEESFESIHNYIDEKEIIRKGAISANKNELMVIALNMAEGMAICRGKGNPEWLYSAPHGLGRMFSRTTAKNTLSMVDFKNDMSGVYSSSIKNDIIDESPRAYKPLDAVLPLISETCEIIEIIKPILNIKY